MSTLSAPIHPRTTIMGPASGPVRALTPKSAGFAAFLSLVWPGFGDIYVDRVASGATVFLAHIALCAFILIFFGLWVAALVHVAASGIAAIRIAMYTTARNRRLFAWRL